MEDKYAIRLGNDRYILWIDECWYETTRLPVFDFKFSDLNNIKKWLVSHYQYKATFIQEKTGKEIKWDYFAEKKNTTQSIFSNLKLF